MKEIPVPAGTLPDERVQLGIDLGQPAAVVNAVGHIFKLVGLGLVGVPEDVPLQNVGVKGGYAVDGLAGADTQVSHAHLATPDNGHMGDLAVVAAVTPLQIPLVTGGDLLQNLPDAGQQSFDQVLRPALQSFRQNGVVGVAHRVSDNMPGFVPAVALIVQQNAHELRDDQGRVGVVDLNDVLPGEVAQGPVLGLVLADNGLHGGRDKEVLLL